jgi:exodeoxyribonuclease V beta subunit
VLARGRAERFVTAAGTWPALTLASDLEPLPAALLRARYAAYNAEQIVALLNDPLAGFDGPQGWRRLQPADIAVLVRSRVEAEAVRRALRERGVASVFLSDQDSVLGSAEAVDLLHWLRAVAEPRDARLARVAYAGGTFGLALAELARIARDDEAWDELQERLVRLQRVWQRQGVLAMLRQTLHLLDLPARWLGDPTTPGGGERRLTNVLHLAELLQSASHHLEGEQALLRWLTEQIADHAAGRAENADDRIVRLESDAGLVQVITVHKSKGLEYPLVFVPFASSTRPVDRRGRRFVESIDAAGQRALDFGLDQAAIDAADRERLREELRLFYVALTRARHGLWLGVGLARYNSRSGEERTTLGRSALGHLLGGSGVVPADGPWTAAQAEAALAQLQSGCAAHIARQTLSWPPLRPSRLRRRDEEAALLAAPTYHGRIDSDWTVGSFSALVRDLGSGGAAAWHFSGETLAEAPTPPGQGGAPAAPLMQLVPPVGRLLGDVLREEALREEGTDLLVDLPAEVQAVRSPESDARVAADPQARHRFPRGALPGNFLHEQLEALAGFGFDQAGSDDFLHLLKRRCERQGRAYRAEEVASWLDDVTRTVLPPLGAPLAEVENFLTEMEFWLPSAGLHAEALDDLCRTHLLPGLARPELPARRLRGLLMGFADLVFEHGGRYWVLDYKSNALGDADGAYTPAALQHAMLQHRYELQAAIYQLALHRLLRLRLGAAYDPAEQLGGAIYLFLRGVAGPARGCVHLPADPALLRALDALLGP